MTPQQDADRKLKTARKRQRYDDQRALSQFMLSLHMPLAWKEKGLGVALRALCQALLDEQGRAPDAGSPAKTLRALVETATARLGAPGRQAEALDPSSTPMDRDA